MQATPTGASAPTRVAAAGAAAGAPLALDQLWDADERPEPRFTSGAEPAATRDGPRVAIAAALACLVAGIGASLFLADPGGDDPGARAERRGQQAVASERKEQGKEKGSGSSSDPGGAAVSVDPEADVTVPDDWSFYEEPDSGFGIAYPVGWQVIPEPSDETSLDFRDPDTGMYLRVDWGSTPGPSPQQAWLDYEPDFAAAHEDYERVAITETTFQGFDASLWEFTYRDGGTELHAVDLGFVTGEYGFALNFQTHEDDWAASESLFEVFKASFVPPEGEAIGS